MLVDKQLPCGGQSRKDLPFQIIALPMIERPIIDHEEPGIDPVIGEPRLFDEPPDSTSLVPLQRAVRRWQRNGGHRHGARVRGMKFEEGLHVDGPETVAVS